MLTLLGLVVLLIIAGVLPWPGFGRLLFRLWAGLVAAPYALLIIAGIIRRGDTMELLIVIGVFVYVVWELHRRWFPGLHRFVTGALRRGGRAFVQLTWRQPMRGFGIAITVWLWIVALAVVASLAGLNALIRSGDAHLLQGAGACWLLVLVSWRVLRWWAHRRYTPRALPTRRRRHEPWRR